MRTTLVGLWVLTAACEPVQPCDEYVDYMCTCHADDTGTDCAALTTSYQDADPKIQDECAVLLNEQEGVDGGQCAGTTATTP